MRENWIKSTNEILRVVLLRPTETTQGKMEVPNEAVLVSEIKVISSKSKDIVKWISVRTACCHARETRYIRLLFKVCQGKDSPLPQSVTLILINICYVQSTMLISSPTKISSIALSILCLYGFCARELRELVKVNL